MASDHEGATPSAPNLQVGRRTVVRTAGGAAWAAPTILVAGAAPARASVSGGEPQVRASALTSTRNGDFLTVAVTLTNDGPADTSGLTVLVRLNDSTTATAALTDPARDVTGGFAYVGIDAPSSTDRTYEFVRLDPQLTSADTPASAMATLGFRIRVYPLVAGNFLGTILVTPVPTGPAGGTGTPAGPTPYN